MRSKAARKLLFYEKLRLKYMFRILGFRYNNIKAIEYLRKSEVFLILNI